MNAFRKGEALGDQPFDHDKLLSLVHENHNVFPHAKSFERSKTRAVRRYLATARCL
jgi:hypothetical protein